MKKIVLILSSVFLCFALCACSAGDVNENDSEFSISKIKKNYSKAHVLVLNGNSATLDGTKLKEYDYTWNYDTSMKEPEYTGDEPDTSKCYIAHDIIYYPEIDSSLFVQENYDGETEWVTHFTNDELKDYLFSTLPVLGNELPTDMMHSKEEAYNNPVIHITQPGDYIVEGNFNGQLFIDLGDKDETFNDESKKINLIFNGCDINCSVAPSVVFYSLYECDNKWEDSENHPNEVDISNAGAKVILVDGTENNFTGTNVFRLLKPVYKKEGSTTQKKLFKTDGAFYSYVSLLIDGKTGIMNINAPTYEGLDSELHLTINGGYVNIVSNDDGINVNEDGVSVFTFNDGRLTIFAGQGAEGDVVDSNGYINVNGGIILGASPSVADNILDSDCGTNISENATIIDNTSSIQGGMPGGPGGTPPEGMPGNIQAGQTPPEIPNGQGGPGGMPKGQGETPPEKPLN